MDLVSKSWEGSVVTQHQERSLNFFEKLIFSKLRAMPPEGVRPGVAVRVTVDWVIASELSWASMDKTYEKLGRPPLQRPDRLWIAADHRVDPRNIHEQKIQDILAPSYRISKDNPDVDFQGPNQTILHTEFYRERVQPGQIVIGSDSHTTSHGGLGAFSVGLGAVDACIPLLCGETWFVVPEVVRVNFRGRPQPGVGGKDIILFILGQLKRNTVTAERAVEFSGPGLQYLSCDARFAICNMCTELGALAGAFVPDGHVLAYLERRKSTKHRKEGAYYRPDDKASYCVTLDLDLGGVSPLVALYPNPDDTHTAKDIEESEHELLSHLDGCFIGACTTTEEDHILAALVLQEGLLQGMRPSAKGHRKVTMGSVATIQRLKDLGLIRVFEEAGFDVEPPGCSLCTGGAYAKALPGEVWLSSQNRNFKNRMGQGAIGSITSAATVAASSFEMRVRDPGFLLAKVDMQKYDHLRRFTGKPPGLPDYINPKPRLDMLKHPPVQGCTPEMDNKSPSVGNDIGGKVLRLGRNVDTDAIIPVPFLHLTEEVGLHCLEFSDPAARGRIRDGYNIVVADENFGCGSSREEAVSALTQAGVKAVIAKSFAYIFQRNSPNLSLLSIVLRDAAFYNYIDSHPEEEISIHTVKREIHVGMNVYSFEMSDIQLAFLLAGGAITGYQQHGSKLFSKATRRVFDDSSAIGEGNLNW